MPAPLLDELPSEVFEEINVQLQLYDLNILRLVSRRIAHLATQKHFGTFLRHKYVEITRPALEFMVELTTKGRIGCFVEQLTLVGVVYNTALLEHQLAKTTRTSVKRIDLARRIPYMPEQPCSEAELAHAAEEIQLLRAKRAGFASFLGAGDAVKLLTRILLNLAARPQQPGLKRISIDVVVYREHSKIPEDMSQRPGWTSVWHKAAETFQTLMLALDAVSIRVQELKIFCNDFSGNCSLQCVELSRCDWQTNGIAIAFVNLEALSISVSDRILNETRYDVSSTGDLIERLAAAPSTIKLLPNLETLKTQATDGANFSGLGALLNVCKGLKQLDLRRCEIRRSRRELDNYEILSFLQHLTQAVHLPTLRVLALRNLDASEPDLLSFLKRHAIKQLTLQKFGLASGSQWSAIFDYLTSKDAGLETLHLEDIFQNRFHVQFCTGQRHFADNHTTGILWGAACSQTATRQYEAHSVARSATSL
ncbi:hypothetical protein CKM354_000789200 [Cercospora kikuchii]|uniref:F-box domain-containing protein n=1 Tax=Cercospora kikuchii TaxID=84275 RepID=A0A9P3FES1_9PEZI|nr:uncharacterized protein CKM354_000789200 [Cercospora kikuchii]GIZ44701.1 hypothetical protein CKM354_000789200 [Cercospora kikuchii]